MSYFGHVKNGVIVLDSPECLEEGIRVRIELAEAQPGLERKFSLRGTQYRFEDPFSPVVADDQWEACG